MILSSWSTNDFATLGALLLSSFTLVLTYYEKYKKRAQLSFGLSYNIYSQERLQSTGIDPLFLPRYALTCEILNSGYSSIIIDSCTIEKTDAEYDWRGQLNGTIYSSDLPKTIESTGRIEIRIATEASIFDVSKISFLDANGNQYAVEKEEVDAVQKELRKEIGCNKPRHNWLSNSSQYR